MTIAEVAERSTRLIDNVGRVILGKREVIEEATVALLCGGHVLFDDVPGMCCSALIRRRIVASFISGANMSLVMW